MIKGNIVENQHRTQETFICSKSIIETLEKGVTDVES